MVENIGGVHAQTDIDTTDPLTERNAATTKWQKVKNLATKTADNIRKTYVDPHNVDYHVIIGKHITDPRQNNTPNPTPTQEKSIFVKCIQTNTTADNFYKFIGLAKSSVMQGVIDGAKQTVGALKNLSIPDLKRHDKYKISDDIVIGNDILDVKCTRSIQEAGGFFVITIHNKDGLYNDIFVKGDLVEIRAGYKEAVGTDFELQTIMLGVIKSVRVIINNNEEVIRLYGDDYENVLRDKSIRDTILRDPLTDDRRHSMKSILKGFHYSLTREFGHSTVPIFYQRMRGGRSVNIIDPNTQQPRLPIGTDNAFQDFFEGVGDSLPIIQRVANNPYEDVGYWDFLQTKLQSYGYYMRLKKSSVKGRRFSRASPQVVIMPMNTLSAEARNYVERFDNPHNFKMGGTPSLHFEGNISEMEIYEDDTFLKNRVIFKLKIPVIERELIEDEETEREGYRVRSRIVFLDSDILLFPERHTNAERFTAFNPYFEVDPVTHVYKLKLRNVNRSGEEDEIKINPTMRTNIPFTPIIEYKNIPIKEKDGRTTKIGDLIDYNQKNFGKRNIILTKDCLPLVQKALQEEANRRELQIHTLGYGVEYDVDMPFDYDSVITEVIKEIIQILVEHIYAIKGFVGLSHGNPSVDLFDCCTITDKRVLKKIKRGGSQLLKNIAYQKDDVGNLTRRKGIKSLWKPNLAPVNSVGTFMEEFRVTSTIDDTITQVIGTDGNIINYLEDFIYGNKKPDRRYIVTYIDHHISQRGYFTKLRFQILPQYYSSEFLRNVMEEANAPHRVERTRLLDELRSKRDKELYLGKVVIPKLDRDYVYSYLQFMTDKEWDAGTEEMGANTQEYSDHYFDRALVSINLGDGHTQEVIASVMRQPFIYTPIRANETVVVGTAQAIENRGESTILKGWVILGVVPTQSSFLEVTSTAKRTIHPTDREKYQDIDIHLKTDYKTGFQSSFVDLLTGINRHIQDSVIIANNDNETYRNNTTEPSFSGTKANISTKVALSSTSKRKSGNIVRRQKSSLNLNSNQPQGKTVNNFDNGSAIAELATYEVDKTTGEGQEERPHAYIRLDRINSDSEYDNAATLEMLTKGKAQGTGTPLTKQSKLVLDGNGNIDITCDNDIMIISENNAAIVGGNLTLIGDVQDTNTEILALDKDKITMEQSLSTVLDAIASAFDVIGSYVGGAGIPLLPQASTAKAAIDLAITSMIRGTNGNEIIGKISANNTTRKIKGVK